MATLEALQELLPTLPQEPVLDLLRRGVCLRCIFRFLNIRSPIYSVSHPDAASIIAQLPLAESAVQDVEDEQKQTELVGPREGASCGVCLGALQTVKQMTDEGGTDLPQTRDGNAAECISEAVNQSGYVFDSFALEISLPVAIGVRERSLWCYLQTNYKENSTFSGEDVNENICSLKEAIKASLLQPLEKSLSAKFDSNSTFRISLSYTHAGAEADAKFLSTLGGGDVKRKRQGQNNHNDRVAGRSQAEPSESLGAVQRALGCMTNELFMRRYICPPSQVEVPCQLAVSCWRNSVYVGGRYVKLSRNISQSRWLVDDERIGDGSVQEIIGDVVLPFFKTDSYKFQAAGREDIDVRMLGDGRPFLLEIRNAKAMPSISELTKAETTINDMEQGWVKVRGLKQVGSEVCALMREGETEKVKEYVAVVWLSRNATPEDFECLSNMKGLELQQKTPIRVLHRRSPLTRPRTIYWMKCQAIEGSENYFLLHLCTQAGTYIKEFVHGDLGRTYPNLGSLLGCTANILQLDVTDVKMDFD